MGKITKPEMEHHRDIERTPERERTAKTRKQKTQHIIFKRGMKQPRITERRNKG